ncbi:MAG: hypothetical protein H0W02_10130 [Ktedonobacteraceae bacterium]|nr:hypothetical protein [Ktedonobacteraceae bacterium]
MAAATCQVQLGTGASVSWANAEGGVTWNLEDTISGVTPIAIPNTTGTNYSWIKNLALAVTVTGTTNITNRRISFASSLTSGLFLFWKAVAVGSYAQASGVNQPAASGTNAATPAGYTLMSTTAAQYDNTSVATSATGPNGSMAVVVFGVDNTYTGGANSGTTLASVIITYDEA